VSESFYRSEQEECSYFKVKSNLYYNSNEIALKHFNEIYLYYCWTKI